MTDAERRGTLRANEGDAVPKSLPKTRPELLELHAAARKRRAAAELGSDDYRAAAEELGHDRGPHRRGRATGRDPDGLARQ